MDQTELDAAIAEANRVFSRRYPPSPDAEAGEPKKGTYRQQNGYHWPLESLDVERRFEQPHARLFPFIGRKVRTPQGPGTLIQVYADHVTVLLDADRDHCARFAPQEIAPAASPNAGGMYESHV